MSPTSSAISGLGTTDTNVRLDAPMSRSSRFDRTREPLCHPERMAPLLLEMVPTTKAYRFEWLTCHFSFVILSEAEGSNGNAIASGDGANNQGVPLRMVDLPFLFCHPE